MSETEGGKIVEEGVTDEDGSVGLGEEGFDGGEDLGEGWGGEEGGRGYVSYWGGERWKGGSREGVSE